MKRRNLRGERMARIPDYEIDPKPSAEIKSGASPRIENPVLARFLEERKPHLRREVDPNSPERIASESRVLIIEGIPGSGKDTFQAYLKQKLKGREIYDYSEGELLHSWKHVPIKGILKLRVKFIKLFVDHLRNIVGRDNNAVFILNRFHLSTYVSTILKQPALRREYDEIIAILKTLPVHVFILQLDENEIGWRSAHPERSTPWQKYQDQRVTKEGFTDTLKRYIWQQNLILEIAKNQSIPYSIIRSQTSLDADRGSIRVSDPRAQIRRGMRQFAIQTKL